MVDRNVSRGNEELLPSELDLPRNVRRAGAADVVAIATFFQTLNWDRLRTLPSEADVAMLVRQEHGGMFLVTQVDRIVGTLGYMLDGAVLRIFLLEAQGADTDRVTGELIDAIEEHAGRNGAALIAAEVLQSSPLAALLTRRGYSVDSAEIEASREGCSRLLDLIKTVSSSE